MDGQFLPSIHADCDVFCAAKSGNDGSGKVDELDPSDGKGNGEAKLAMRWEKQIGGKTTGF